MAFGHGPTDREEEILGLWDQKLAPLEIAERLGVGRPYIENVIARLGNAGASNPFDRMVERGSAALLDALRRHHPAIARSPDTG